MELGFTSDKLNFTVGPVMMPEDIREIGRQQVPYFRTAEFSKLMLENESMLKELSKAEKESRAVFLTGSGTAAMEMAVSNVFDERDKVLVVDGGSFGHRFCQLCEIYNIPYESISLEPGEELTEDRLYVYDNQGFSGMLINMHETSTGVLYDMSMVSAFCRKNNMLLIVDAISAFLAEVIETDAWGIDILIMSSQKALALPPGISFLILNEKVQKHIAKRRPRSMYFDINDYLKNGERGQTPFTPAVGILIQLHERLRQLCQKGIDQIVSDTRGLALYFREGISGLPFELLAKTPSNAVTALRVTGDISAKTIFERIDKEYDMWVCPNGGELAETVFRVGHIGDLTKQDYDKLVNALKEVCGGGEK